MLNEHAARRGRRSARELEHRELRAPWRGDAKVVGPGQRELVGRDQVGDEGHEAALDRGLEVREQGARAEEPRRDGAIEDPEETLALTVVTLSIGEFNLTWMLHTPYLKTLPVGLADSYASMRLEVASAYTLIFFVMIVPLLMAMQWATARAQRIAQ